MTSWLKAVCLIAALLATLAASGAVASPILTAEEMSAVRGGWVQLWCQDFDCAAPYRSGCWELHGLCDPGIPYLTCDNDMVNPETKPRCLNGTNTGDPCTQGPLKGCGPIYHCNCLYVALGLYECERSLTTVYNRHYYPCQ